MTFRHTAIALMFSVPLAASVSAQTVGTEVQRDVNQESRIERGLQSGQLSTGEAVPTGLHSRTQHDPRRLAPMQAIATLDQRDALFWTPG
ncbi:MAG TPA: hypothetical protein VLL06_06485 [Nitrospiraceae bacterium]|nr:hypothetical protein [Nitrospiraceae bacterium]